MRYTIKKYEIDISEKLVSLCEYICLSGEISVPMLFVAGKSDKQALLLNYLEQGVNAFIMGSVTGYFNVQAGE